MAKRALLEISVYFLSKIQNFPDKDTDTCLTLNGKELLDINIMQFFYFLNQYLM